MTSELAALKIQLSEEINKQRALQKECEEKKVKLDKESNELKVEKERFEKQKEEIVSTVETKKTELQTLNDKYKKTEVDLKKINDELAEKEKKKMDTIASSDANVVHLEEQIRKLEGSMLISKQTLAKK